MTGDINGDGIVDLVTAPNFGVAHVEVRLGTGSGSFGTASTYATPTPNQLRAKVRLGDVNGDGTLDLVTAGYEAVYPANVELSVRFGNGSGSFGAAITYQNSAETNLQDLELGDLNGDGLQDVITTGYFNYYGGSISVRFGTKTGLSASDTTYTEVASTRFVSVDLGDLNGDGILDVISSGDNISGNDLFVRLGTGSGTFGASTSYLNGSAGDIALGDLNGDGVLDLISAGGIRMARTVPGAAPLLPFSLKTLADARQALPVFKRKREQLAEQRGEIGAFQSRIEVARNVLEVSSENFRAAESRIRDADIADESSRLVRLNILQQAASAILAQANQQPALALQLLGRT